MSVEELLRHIPAIVRYRRMPVSDADNALGPSREAVERITPEHEDISAAWVLLCPPEPETAETAGEPECDIDAEPDEPFDFPGGEHGQTIRALVQRNGPVLELLDECLRRGKLQLPQAVAQDPWTRQFDYLAAMRDAARLWLARARAHAADGRFDEAGQDLVRILRFGRLFCAGDCLMVDFLVGLALQRVAARSVRAFAAVEGVARHVLADMLHAVRQCLGQPDRWAQTMRFEFCCWILFEFDRFPEHADAGVLFDLWQPPIPSDPEMEDLTALVFAASRERRPERRRHFVFLLEGHPHPFDKTATARLLGLDLADAIRRVEGRSRSRLVRWATAWTCLRGRMRRRRLDRQLAAWPDTFSKHTFLQDLLAVTDGDADAAMADMPLAGGCPAREIKPPTEQELTTAKQRLRRLDNPFGVLLAKQLAVDPELPAHGAEMARYRLAQAAEVLERALRA